MNEISRISLIPIYRAILVLMITAIASRATSGQDMSVAQPLVSNATPLEMLRQRLSQSAAAGTRVPLEGAVDPEEYRVGPGDVFRLSIGGVGAFDVPISVTADGHALLPDAGVVFVGGLTLADARAKIIESLRLRHRRVPVDVALAEPRQFYVHVAGAVPAPGRYLVLPVARVSDALAFAFSDSVAQPVTNPDFAPSLRNVRITRRDGSATGADIVRYFSTGENDANPYLRDGDVVSVAAYAPDRESIFVSGSVPFPGNYDYRTDDDALVIVALASGLPISQVDARVRIVRASPASLDTVVSVGIKAERFPLRARDHVFVLPEKLVEGTASVTGHVRFPGTYPIEQDRTTVDDLIRLAGGLRADALPRAAYLQRRVLDRAGVAAVAGSRFGSIPARRDQASDSTRILELTRMAEMDFFGTSDFSRQLRWQNRVAVFLDPMSPSYGGSVTLRDGDHLVVPRDQNTVFVFGQVRHPGFVAFESGRTVDGYITAAGGKGPEAGDVYLVDAATGSHLNAAGVAVRSGDLIFVSRKMPLALNLEAQRLIMEQERLRSDYRFRTTSIVIQSLGTIATVVALIVSLRN